MIRILNAEPLNYCAEARRVLQSIGELEELSLARDELIKTIPVFDVLIVRLGLRIDREILDAGQRLRVIVTATTGLDHIDLGYAASRGVAVLSLRGETEFLRSVSATAEHTWALLLSLVRRVPWAFRAVSAGQWNRDDFRGHELSGKRLGIIGLGRIGEKVARYGLSFQMSAAAYDPYRAGWMEDVKRYPTMALLLEQSDILSVHVPLARETTKLIGNVELRHLPAGAILINTSRGGVLDETALLEALETGHLGGAALDVASEEQEKEHPQLNVLRAYCQSHCNLLITPHIGGATVESMANTELFMAHKLYKFLGLAGS